MKVKATRKGYYGLRRRAEGEEFHIEEKHFSEKWMVAADGKEVVAKAKPAPKAKAKKQDDDVI